MNNFLYLLVSAKKLSVATAQDLVLVMIQATLKGV